MGQPKLLETSKSPRWSTRTVAPRQLLTASKFAPQRVMSSRSRTTTPWSIRPSPPSATLPCQAPTRPTQPSNTVRSTTHSQLTPAQRSPSATRLLQPSPQCQADLSRPPFSAVRSLTPTCRLIMWSASSMLISRQFVTLEWPLQRARVTQILDLRGHPLSGAPLRSDPATFSKINNSPAQSPWQKSRQLSVLKHVDHPVNQPVEQAFSRS